jgi:hypothetical protein
VQIAKRATTTMMMSAGKFLLSGEDGISELVRKQPRQDSLNGVSEEGSYCEKNLEHVETSGSVRRKSIPSLTDGTYRSAVHTVGMLQTMFASYRKCAAYSIYVSVALTAYT